MLFKEYMIHKHKNILFIRHIANQPPFLGLRA